MTFAEALTAMVSALSVAGLERTGVTYTVEVGDEKLEKGGAPPSIAIVPLSAEPAPARSQPPGTVRSIAAENHLFLARLWGKGPKADTAAGSDYVAVSTMRATFTQAMRATFGPSFQLMGGEWTATDGTSINEHGRKYDQRFTLSALSLDLTPTAVTVLHTTLNIGITNPGTDLVGP